MKFLIVFAAAVACACAADLLVSPSYRLQQNARIIHGRFDMSPEGQYEWAIETENGIEAGAHGDVKYQGTDGGLPEGEHVDMTYQGDENGYKPEGRHIPTPPPIPPMILRALEYIAAHPPTEYKSLPLDVYKKS